VTPDESRQVFSAGYQTADLARAHFGAALARRERTLRRRSIARRTIGVVLVVGLIVLALGWWVR
jgi:hypothetical protein